MSSPLAAWAARKPGVPAALAGAVGKIPKQAVLYLHVVRDVNGHQTQYQCRDCAKWIADLNRCTEHGLEDQILADGGCGLFVRGESVQAADGAAPKGYVTIAESGYEENGPGFSCKRCVFFLPGTDSEGGWFKPGDCQRVAAASSGDDPGGIHPDACCNGWSPGQTSDLTSG